MGQWSFQAGGVCVETCSTMGSAVWWVCVLTLALVGWCPCDVLGNRFCKSGASSDGHHCSGGCVFGSGAKEGERACSRDTLHPRLSVCLGPPWLKTKNRYSYRQAYAVCEKCWTRYSGAYCSRENIAYPKNASRRPIQDEDLTRCGKISGEKKLYLRSPRSSAAMIDIHLKQADQRANQSRSIVDSCSIDGCNEKVWASDLVLRLKCKEARQTTPYRLIIECTDKREVKICEVMVYQCAEFWWDLENGCNQSCNCQDGVNCDPWTGECPSGKEITTTTSTTEGTSDVQSSSTSTAISSSASSATLSSPATSARLSSSSLSSPSAGTSTYDTRRGSLSTAEKSGDVVTQPAMTTLTDGRASTSEVTSEKVTSEEVTSEVTSEKVTSEEVTSEVTSEKVTSEKVTSEVTSEKVTSEKVTSEKVTSEKVTSTEGETSEVPTSTLTDAESTTFTAAPTPVKSSVTPKEEDKDEKGANRMTSTLRTLPTNRRVNDDDDDDEDDDWGSGGMTSALGALGAIGVLVALAVVAAFMYKKKQNETKAKEKDETACVVDMEMNDRTLPASKEEENEYENTLEPFVVTTDPIAADAFRNHVCHMKRTGGFSKEYQELPYGIQGPVTAALEADDESVRKNRFKDISPYDEFRVILKKEKESDSDYINASYIAGFNEAMAYIAAQGPLPDTVRDLWHMVWTEGCSRIIMLTNLCEGSKIKCEQYWPGKEGDSQTFGAYEVTCVKITQKAHFIHRRLSVAKHSSETTGSKPEPAREIQHMHFTAWPDHGVPCPVALVRFWSSLGMQHIQLGGPMVVHCSAGIGRTGTFIALDMLTHQVETTGKLSVFPTVRRLRKQRVNMVQTLSQYQFLHEVVQEWLACRDGDLVRSDLQHGAQWRGEEGGALTQLPADARQRCAAQFQSLSELRPALSNNDTATASMEENTAKNRAPDILPVEQFRVCLAQREENDSDYINAVFLPSVRSQQGYIVTQLPLDSTVVDFWRMVRDWRVRTIVRFRDTPSDQEVGVYPDTGQKVQHGDITITTTNVTTVTPGLSLYTLQETESGSSSGRKVRVYSVESQPAVTLRATKVFVSLAGVLLPLVTAVDQPPLVLQCFTGAGPSCVLCGVLTGINSLQEEDRTSPFLLARLVQTIRPHAFTTPEQYEFMVRCLVHHTRGVTEEGETDTAADSGQDTPASKTTDNIYANV